MSLLIDYSLTKKYKWLYTFAFTIYVNAFPAVLVNSSNNCYTNAMLQCLFSLSDLNKTLLNGSRDSYHPLVTQYIKLYQEAQTSEIIDPIDFHNNLIKHLSIETSQHEDAYNLLNKFMHYIAQTSPSIEKLIKIVTRTTICCQQCSYCSVRQEKCNGLTLGLTDCSNAQQCIDKFCSLELLANEDAYFCKGCNIKTQKNKKTTILQASDIVIIQIKRFNNYLEKDSHAIKIDSICINNHRYNLVACILHSGSLSNGHYTASCFDQEKQQWIYFDDINSICNVDINLILNYSKHSPYILFYQISHT